MKDQPPLSTAIVPRATYRVQFHAGFRFVDAIAAVPYWKSLGISHLYASPYLRARAGSTHGYDVTDHNTLNPEVGTEAEFDRLCETLKANGMHQLLDIVPNHMGVMEGSNTWWGEVLEHGQASEHASSFDIDWDSPVPGMRGRVMLALLGVHYGAALEAGELVLAFEPELGNMELHYFEHRFPIDPADYAAILSRVPVPPAAHESERSALTGLVDGFAALRKRGDPPNAEPDKRPGERRQRASELKKALVDWCGAGAWQRSWIDECLSSFKNGTQQDPRPYAALDELLQRQAWRLTHWRTAGNEINYRRFFDVNSLAAVRSELESVFNATHRTVLKWVAEGRLAGLRIDHPDGLSDPATYLERLQRRHVQAQRESGAPPTALYVVVEKILADDEALPADWLAHGDTGYHYSNQVNGVLVDTTEADAFTRIYESFSGVTTSYDETLHTAKQLVISSLLASDLELLTSMLHRIARGDRQNSDYTRASLRQAMAEIAANFPVYRSYIGSGTHGGNEPGQAREPTEQDRAWTLAAANAAKGRVRGAETLVIDYVCSVLLDGWKEPDPKRRTEMLRFATRWQQFTSPVMAKAMEDTTFYRYLRLVSLNDVGGDPRQFGLTVDAFHQTNIERAQSTPHTLVGTSTHDSKRSEDVRARLDVLTEMPEEWEAALQRWQRMNAAAEPSGNAVATVATVPSRNHEYLLYQTLVGAWPGAPLGGDALDEFKARIQAYMLKAVREAKDETSWLDPHEPYEKTLATFIDRILADQRFTRELNDFVAKLLPFGQANSLCMVALKLTSPGVPDIYQGCETWNFSLVDPDNRRPIDLGAMAESLRSIDARRRDGGFDQAAISTMRSAGELKLLITASLLRWRAEQPQLFRDGSYEPLQVTGPAADHVVAFARRLNGAVSITVTGRLLCKLGRRHVGTDVGASSARQTSEGAPAVFDPASQEDAWRDTVVKLPAGLDGGSMTWTNVVSGRDFKSASERSGGGSLRVGELLRDLPVAVLKAGASGS